MQHLCKYETILYHITIADTSPAYCEQVYWLIVICQNNSKCHVSGACQVSCAVVHSPYHIVPSSRDLPRCNIRGRLSPLYGSLSLSVIIPADISRDIN